MISISQDFSTKKALEIDKLLASTDINSLRN